MFCSAVKCNVESCIHVDGVVIANLDIKLVNLKVMYKIGCQCFHDE